MRVFFIGNLNLHYLELRDAEVVDADLIVITGNISSNMKRGLLYAEDVAKKNPTTPVILNFGLLDLTHTSSIREIYSAANFRYNSAKVGPPNLFFPTSPQEINGVTFLATVGFPKWSKDEFEHSDFSKGANSEHWTKLFIDGIKVTDRLSKKLTYEEYNLWAAREKASLKHFDLTDFGTPKVLVTAVSEKHLMTAENWCGSRVLKHAKYLQGVAEI